MADVRLFDVPVGLAVDEALAEVSRHLEGIPEAQETFAARHDNPALFGSLASLVAAARDDHQVRDEHGVKIMLAALAQVAVHGQPTPRSRAAARR